MVRRIAGLGNRRSAAMFRPAGEARRAALVCRPRESGGSQVPEVTTPTAWVQNIPRDRVAER